MNILKSSFPYVPARSFREWSINMRVTIDASHILYTSNSTNGCNNNAQGNCEEEKVESKKNCERESWSKE